MEVSIREDSVESISISISWLIQYINLSNLGANFDPMLKDIRDFCFRLGGMSDSGGVKLLSDGFVKEFSTVGL